MVVQQKPHGKGGDQLILQQAKSITKRVMFSPMILQQAKAQRVIRLMTLQQAKAKNLPQRVINLMNLQMIIH